MPSIRCSRLLTYVLAAAISITGSALYAADTIAPTIPQGLTATAVSASRINLAWSASTDNVKVTGYRIYRGGTAIGTTKTTSYSNIGLIGSTTYTYTVAAYDAANNQSAQSSQASATTLPPPDTSAPSIPQGLAATAVSSSQINLNWSASSDNVGVTGYRVYRGGTIIATTSATSYSHTGLNASTSYTYRVSAYDAAGNVSARSNPVTATTLPPPDTTAPSIPQGLSATAASSSQIDLSWSASTDNVGVTGYRIYRGGTVVGTAATTSYSDTGLTPSTLYSYKVTAYDAASNESGQSSAASATTLPPPDTSAPSIPQGLTATAASSSQINLSWSASTDNVGVTGYRIYRGGTAVGTTATTSYSDTGLTPSTLYSYKVTAYDAASNESGQSSAASATTLAPPDTTAPSIPQGLTATAASSSRIDLSWSASTDNLGVTGYRIYRAGTAVGTTATTSYSDTGLTPSTLYSYKVTAYDAASNESGQSSPASATTLAPPDTSAPSIPQGLTATAASSSQIDLSWSASTDNVGVTGYRIYRGGTAVGTTATTSYSDTGLTPSTLYSYKVTAYDAASNESGQSSPASATTLSAPDTTAPSIPQGLSATAASSSQIDLSWSASTDNVGVTGYRIYRGGTAVGTTATTSYSDTGLTPSTLYSYKVTAYDAASNESGQSSPASATTLSAPDTTAPIDPARTVGDSGLILANRP